MSATPFKVEKSDKAFWFDKYYFHCIDCGAEFWSHRCDRRTNPYCCDCKRKHDKERTKELAKQREAKKVEEIRNKAIDELRQMLRAEFEQMMDLEIDDCINWADSLDAIAQQLKDGGTDG